MILPVFWFKIYFYFQVLLLGFFSKSMSKNLLLKPTLLKLGVFALSALICVGTVNVCSASSRYKTTITAVSSDEIRLGADRSKIGETPVIKQKLIIGSFKKGETFNKAAKRAGLSAKEIHQIQQILADKLDYLLNGSTDMGFGKLEIVGSDVFRPAERFSGRNIQYIISGWNRYGEKL